jgi:O-antigen/teichoic acid export membrane protein
MSLKKKAITGIIWTYGQQFSVQVIQFLVSIILARIITPEEFGLIGMITIFMGIGMVLFDGGMTSSLIRTLKPSNKDYSTVFIFNIFCSIIIYIFIFFLAPFYF